nr:unnamed protein product [Callosobruchus chinensis]
MTLICIIEPSKVKCKMAVEYCITLLENLGFKINYEKSTTDPTCELTCLGFTYNTLDMTLFIPEKKKRDTKDSLKKFKNKNKGSILFFSKLIGKLVAAGPTLNYGWVHIKNFEREKYLALKKFNNNYNMPPLQFGAVIAMTAAFYALKSFGKNYKNCDILLRIDNKAAIACINKGLFGTGVKQMTSVFLHLTVLRKKISNADLQSRSLSFQTDQFVGNLKNPEIDLFASKLNAKCKIYASWGPDPDSTHVDAFTIK